MVLEALEGTAHDPVSLHTVIERVGFIPDLDRQLKPDAAKRILLTLELVGWAKKTEQGLWMLGSRISRFSNRYTEVVIANTIK